MRKILPISILFVFLSCTKSNNSNNTNPPQNNLELQLSGQWQVEKYIISNFDTTEGRPYIPNDTIFPVHTEIYNFSKDSLFTDNWQNNIYNYTTNPYTFKNTQTKQFTGSFFCTYGKNYFVTRSNTYNDTNIVSSISAIKLILTKKTPITYNPLRGVLYTKETYLKK